MGLASALSTALTGLNASETTIDVVGNNVANSNTVGFKASNAVFATQFLQTTSLGSAPSDNRGGTNPRQTGLGTKVAEITPDFTQGTIQVSNNPSDLAIQGDGFFQVEGTQGERFFTRNGIFKTNSQNELVTVNGQRLLGNGVDGNFQIQTTGLEALVIPLGQAAVAQATQNVVLAGTLTPTGDIADKPEIIESAVLSDGSKEYPLKDVSDTPVVFTAVASPLVNTTTTTAAAGGSIEAGTYRYRITYVDANNQESPPSNVIGPITTTGNVLSDQTVTLGNLPAVPAGFTGRRIYRTDATGTGDYKLVSSALGASVNDTASNAARTTTLDQSSLTQGNYGYYVTFYDSGSGAESRPTPLLGPVSLSVDGRRIQLSNLDQPGVGSGYNQIRIYRNTATDSENYHLVTTLDSGRTSYIDGATDASIASSQAVNLDGPPISAGMLLTDVVKRDGATYTHPFEVGTLSFAGRKGGRTLGANELEITPTTTVGDLVTFVQQALGIQPTNADPQNPLPGTPGGTIDSLASTLKFTGNNGVGNAIEIGLSSFKITPPGGIAEQINLGFASDQTAVGESAITDFVAYDSLGIPVNVRVTTVLEKRDGLTNTTTYRWFADSGDNQPATGSSISVGTGEIIFDGEGNVSVVTNSTVSIERKEVSSKSPLEFKLDFSGLSGLDANKSTLAATRQDGSGAGVLSSFIIGEDGLIRGVFSNGISRDLGQIRLVRFANNSGLEARGENLYSAGVNSGLPLEGNPGDQGIGTLVAGATELSNTDIGKNLIDLITASTQYRGGTRVITAVQQLLDELLNLRR